MSADVVLLIVLLLVTNLAWFSVLWNLDELWAARYNRLLEDSEYEWVDYECRDGHWTVTPTPTSRLFLAALRRKQSKASSVEGSSTAPVEAVPADPDGKSASRGGAE